MKYDNWQIILASSPCQGKSQNLSKNHKIFKMKNHSLYLALVFFTCLFIGVLMSCSPTPNESESSVMEEQGSTQPLKALIIDGENNHGIWPKTTMMMKDYLEETGLFEVDIERTANVWLGPHYDKSIGLDTIITLLEMYPLAGNKSSVVEEPIADTTFNPSFSNYDLIISNMGWKASKWSDTTQKNFEEYMAKGGGLVVIHASNNSWADWTAWNEMIGLGGWGGRNTQSGPYVYYDDKDELQKDISEGDCGSHGPQYEFVLETRAPAHPIMKGLPSAWLHTKDELYDRLRGPGENMTVLATAYSDVAKNSPPWNQKMPGTGRHEPMLMALEYGKGRIFHSALGHMDYSMECVGFITTLQRGAEWAATGTVTQAIPEDFPNAAAVSVRSWKK